MSHQASAWAIEVRVGDPTLKALLMAIAHRADRVTWSCWPSLDCLAYDTEVSKRTIQRRLEELQERGFIRIDKRRRPDGTQDNSLITITGGQVVTLQPPVDKIGFTGGQKQGSPVDTAVHHKEQEEQEEQNLHASRGRSGRQLIYTDVFETQVWAPYPRKTGTSKKAAFVRFSALSDSDQQVVISSIPVYKRLKAGKDEEHMHHLEFYISKRIFETVSISKEATTTIANWPAQATREQWARVLRIYHGDSNWRSTWGPGPGKPGCYAPADLIEEILQRP